MTTLATVAVTGLNVVLGAACLVAVAWWEMGKGRNPLDPAWLNVVMQETGGYLYALPPLFWLVALVAFLWWRGTGLARQNDSFQSMLLRFFWGTVALLGLLAMEGAAALGPVLGVWLLAAYLLFGLISMGASRLESAQRERLGSVDGGWQWRSAALALLLLVGGFGLALLLLPQLGEVAAWLRHWLFDLLVPLLLETLRWIVHILGLDRPPEAPPMAPEAGPSSVDVERIPEGLSLPERIREIMRLIFGLTWGGLILLALYGWVRSWSWGRRRKMARRVARERLPWDLCSLLGALLLWPLRALLACRPSLARWLGWAVRSEERAGTVRELYRRLLAWGAGRGFVRDPWVTPREYGSRLSARWPALESDLRGLTESYLRCRYGSVALGQEELESAVAEWRRIAKHVERKGRR